MKRIKVSLLLVTLASLFLFGFYSNSCAQTDPCTQNICDGDITPACPSDAPPTNVSWSHGCITLPISLCPGVTCSVTICYCYRHTTTDQSNGWDYSITKIVRNCPAGCDPGLQALVDGSFTALFDANPAGFPCPPCSEGVNIEYREVRGTCFIDDPVNKVSKICANSGWCITKYDVCCTNGVQTRTKTGHTSLSACITNGCTLINCP